MKNLQDRIVKGIDRIRQGFEEKPISNILINCGVPPKSAVKVFELFSREGDQEFNKFHAVKNGLVNNNIFFTGDPGIGKTTKAIALMYHTMWCWHGGDKNQFAPNNTCFFKSVPDLFLDLRNSFSKPNHRFIINDDKNQTSIESAKTANEILLEQYKNYDLLVLDDLGIDKPTDWVMTMLYSILTHRYNYDKHTIITSNYSIDGLAKQFNDTRLASRISSWYITIEFDCGDLRKK